MSRIVPHYAFLFGDRLLKGGTVADFHAALVPLLRFFELQDEDDVEIIKFVGLVAVARLAAEFTKSVDQISSLKIRTTSDVHRLMVTSIINGSPSRNALVLGDDGNIISANLSSRMYKRLANIVALSSSEVQDKDESSPLPLPGVCIWDGENYVPDDEFYTVA